ncbi:MAG: polyprenyl synthetase family protein [Magnetococcales bacterium]|nr:polyprenyl synthetase family protein [Magnetococcales bacterium]
MTDHTQSVLNRLRELIGPDLEQTNHLIRQHLDSEVELIPTLGTHLIQSGGKRLRPILSLLSARLFGYQGNEHALLAAVIEFIHTATLLHDDVVDKSNTRRGMATANSVWGNKAPVLVGDFLFSRSFQLLVNHGSLRILKIIADTCAIISEGEVLQLVASNDLKTSEEKYMAVVSNKTASLFSAACQIGPVLANSPEAEVERMARFGTCLGIAYQVVDDTLDYAATVEKLGKTIGDDFQEGKITLPVIHAYAKGSPEERAFWVQTIEKGQIAPDSLDHAIALIRQRGAFQYAMERARSFAAEAKAVLEPCRSSPEKEALIMLADFSVDRSF